MASPAVSEPPSGRLDDLQKLVALCKRRGFVFSSAEIYGGFANTYDYGPLGTLLKNNVRDAWVRANVQLRDDIELIDAALITSPKVWVASGHVEAFNDPLVQCLGECKNRYRADQIDLTRCPNCGGPLSEPRMFNTMFKTQVGPVADEENVAYLPPETAQGIFVNFVNVATTMRRKLPFGIAQVRKSFRNEITPGNFVFRTLEFEQMEIEYFVEPGTDEQWFDYWVEQREGFYKRLGIREDNLRRFEHPQDKLSHYSKRTVDIEYRFPFGEGWGELEGIANRSKGGNGDSSWDLAQHEKHSGQRMMLFDDAKKQHVRPGVVEPAAGLTRAALTFLIDAYEEQVLDEKSNDQRTVLHLHPALAPYKFCVLPLYRNKPDLFQTAREIYEDLRRSWNVTFDSGSNIGKLYRRQDEIGTPYCVTVDFQSLDDKQVTVRDRDSMQQERVPIAELRAWFEDKLNF